MDSGRGWGMDWEKEKGMDWEKGKDLVRGLHIRQPLLQEAQRAPLL